MFYSWKVAKINSMNEVGAVILAGGMGTRFHGQKQFFRLWGKELWRHVYDKMCQLIPKEQIVVVGVDVTGGETRSRSVMIGLDLLKPCSKVLLVEAARPLVTVDQLQALTKGSGESSWLQSFSY